MVAVIIKEGRTRVGSERIFATLRRMRFCSLQVEETQWMRYRMLLKN